MKDERYVALLLEDINHKFDVILEATAVIPHMQKDIAHLQADMHEVKADIRVMKLILKDLSEHSNRHHDTFRSIGRLLRVYA